VSFGEKLSNEGMNQLVLLANGGSPAEIIHFQSIELTFLNSALLMLSFSTILLFKNRILQMRLCMIGSLLTLIMLVLVFYIADSMPGSGLVHYQLGTYILVLQLVLFFMARKFIRKDEIMVRAADRIR
jgi:hypothetical protein